MCDLWELFVVFLDYFLFICFKAETKTAVSKRRAEGQRAAGLGDGTVYEGGNGIKKGEQTHNIYCQVGISCFLYYLCIYFALMKDIDLLPLSQPAQQEKKKIFLKIIQLFSTNINSTFKQNIDFHFILSSRYWSKFKQQLT